MQLPRQVACVLDAGVHSLSACGTVRVGGVDQEEGVAVPELVAKRSWTCHVELDSSSLTLPLRSHSGARVWISSSMSCWVGTGVPGATDATIRTMWFGIGEEMSIPCGESANAFSTRSEGQSSYFTSATANICAGEVPGNPMPS